MASKTVIMSITEHSKANPKQFCIAFDTGMKTAALKPKCCLFLSLWSLYLTEGKLYFLEVLHVQRENGGYFAVGVRLPNGEMMRPITKQHLVMYIPGKKSRHATHML